MKNKKKLIPELRFPDFENEGEWQYEELGKISEIVRGGSPRPIQDFLTTNDDGLNWLKIADVPSDSKYITETKEKVIKEALNSTREVSPGDLILSNSMSFGRPYILKIKTCIHDGWIAIRKISNITFEDYLYYFISSESSQSYFQINAAGAAVKNLNAEIIKLLPIYLPKNKGEQQKIASCLSTLDDLIEAHSQKLELLKDHKKGLMQNLFPQKGKKVPKLRFKEFENEGEWEIKTLSGICDITNGKANAQDHVDNGRYPLFDRSEVIKASDEFIFDCEAVIIPGEGMKFIPKYYEGKFNLHQRAYALKDFSCSGQFVYYSMLHRSTLLSQKAVQSTVLSLRLPILQDFPIEIPKKPEEQEKIASCLSSLDEVISAHNQKLELLKAHKKGLMQGLFPKNY